MFKFNLESVLKYRKRQEEMAQREFAEAQAAVDACLTVIESMYRRSDEVRGEILVAQKLASTDQLDRIREMELFLTGQKIRIEAKRMEARELIRIAEEKQEALILAAQEKKVLAKLKEKRKLECQEHVRRIEAKELDDMTMVRHKWGKR